MTLDWATPVKGVSLHVNRINKFKPYNSDEFVDWDTGKQPDPWLTNPSARTKGVKSTGFISSGLRYKGENLKAQAWYYRIYERMNVAYGDAQYTTKANLGGFKGVVAAQYAREWDIGNAATNYANTDANLYGLKLGVTSRYHSFYIVYADNPAQDGAAKGGAFRSPYQYNSYDASPLYTDFPAFDITSSQMPGQAIGLRYIWHVPKWTVIAGLAHMKFDNAIDNTGAAMASGSANGRSLIVVYRPSKKFDVHLMTAYNATATPIPERFFASRLFINYRFSL